MPTKHKSKNHSLRKYKIKVRSTDNASFYFLENAFQLPTWDSKSPAPSKPYILRARNLEKWNSAEINGLFQVFNPKKVKKDGDDKETSL